MTTTEDEDKAKRAKHRRKHLRRAADVAYLATLVVTVIRHPWLLAVFAVILAAIWVHANYTAWRHVSTTRDDDLPFNWRIVLGPGVYYDWVRNTKAEP